MGGEEARRAARALGRNYRSSGRGRMHAVLDGFVVDDGDAFLSEVCLCPCPSVSVSVSVCLCLYLCLCLCT